MYIYFLMDRKSLSYSFHFTIKFGYPLVTL